MQKGGKNFEILSRAADLTRSHNTPFIYYFFIRFFIKLILQSIIFSLYTHFNFSIHSVRSVEVGVLRVRVPRTVPA